MNAPTLLSLEGPPREVMPLSIFLMMHGCSMTETARAGMGNHGASCCWSSPTRSCSVFMVVAKARGQRASPPNALYNRYLYEDASRPADYSHQVQLKLPSRCKEAKMFLKATTQQDVRVHVFGNLCNLGSGCKR